MLLILVFFLRSRSFAEYVCQRVSAAREEAALDGPLVVRLCCIWPFQPVSGNFLGQVRLSTFKLSNTRRRRTRDSSWVFAGVCKFAHRFDCPAPGFS